ncbi:MAG: PLP-dependent aminotransferase family protein [Rhodospirillales bacterium]|nr:PLP-dependent aminotransferase family protein [Rhodospirillales bacterium]
METIWQPDLTERSGPLYRAIAERLAEDIRERRLEAGQRLPTMRILAERLEVTVGTVYRAYALAETQGLVVRQMGRGTFVRGRGADEAVAPAATEGTVDLSRNEPVEIPLGATLRRTLAEMGRESDLEGLLDYGFSQGQPRHREVLARWIGRRGFAADPERMIVTSGAQQALTIALGALTRAGDTLMVEALTYPGIKNLARLFGLKLRPLAIDRDGLDPGDLRAACRDEGARVLYCMPNVHNPTTATLSAARRREVAELAGRHSVLVIEDDVYPRAAEAPPAIAELRPEQTVYISSLSKTVAPGLRVGSITAPARLYPDLVAVTQTTSWMAPPLMAELACRWIEDGTAEALERQREAVTRQLHGVAETALEGAAYRREPHNAHLWLPLEAPWSGAEFAAKAAGHRILVTPAEHFAIDPNRAPAAVRLCLSALDEDLLSGALKTLVALARGGPGPAEFRM